jgi:hypothetical protein
LRAVLKRKESSAKGKRTPASQSGSSDFTYGENIKVKKIRCTKVGKKGNKTTVLRALTSSATNMPQFTYI